MFKRQPARKPATPTGKGEAPPTPAAIRTELEWVEQRDDRASFIPMRGDRSPSREQIAIHAYYRWLARGQPIGTDWEDWFEAERQLAATA